MPIGGGGVPANRDVRSREIAVRADPPAQHWREAHLEQLDLTLGQSVSVAHFAPPWTVDKTSRRHHRLMGYQINPWTREISCLLRDERETLLNGMWLRFDFSDQGDFLNGLYSVMPHTGVYLFTGSTILAENPLDGSVSRQLPRAYSRAPRWKQAKISTTRSGLWIERQGSQRNYRSGYTAGTTGLVATAGNSTFAAQAVPAGLRPFFRWDEPDDASTWTSQCIEITAAGAAPTGGGYSHPASTTLSASVGEQLLSVDHCDDSGAVLYARIQRASDGWYWNAGTPAWQAGTVDNALALRVGDWGRDTIKFTGGVATTVTVSIIQATGGTVSRKNRVACVEIYDYALPRTRLVTNDYSGADPTSGYASSDFLAVTNNTGSRVWNATRGTCLMRFTVPWASASLPTSYIMYLLFVYYDANNSITVAYDNSTGFFRVRRTVGGVATNASVTMAVVASDVISIAIRWASPTSDVGELDGTYGSAGGGSQQNFDLSVYSVASAVVLRGAGANVAPTETTESTLQIGGGSGNLHANVAWHDFGVVSYVLTDAEVDAWLKQTVQVWTP